MDSFHYNFPNIDEVKSILTTANDNQVTTTTAKETFVSSPIGGSSNAQGSVFSPLAAPFQSRIAMPTQQEPRVAETAPSTADLDEVLMNMRINSSDSLFEERPTQNVPNYFLGNRAESVASTSRHTWTENSTPKNADIYDSFDFFLKTLSSANTYASMLTRDQLSVMQAIRPGLLYEFLKEVARVRSDRRMQRALPHECAFCKNNGENEENYSTHALKDWRGRVQCPVLRAFRCPRCGATGDHAHTIKYCQASDGLLRRRFPSTNSFVTGEGSRMSSYVPSSPTTTPVQSPSVTSTLNPSSFWSNYGVN